MPAEPRPASRGNVFTNKIGPLPMWMWLVIAGLLIVGWGFLSQRKKAAAQTTPAGTSAGQVPQFVNQTYTSVTPPTVNVPPPSVTVNNPAPSGSPTPPPPTPNAPPGPGPTSVTLAGWKAGQPESAQAWNADLNNIAQHFGISLAALEGANPQIQDPDKIAAGTRINVPAGATFGR